jgi:hypothetical protein
VVASPAAATTEWWAGPADPVYEPGAGDENRTRTISLGIRPIGTYNGLDLDIRYTVSDRDGPCDTGANGPPMAHCLDRFGRSSGADIPSRRQPLLDARDPGDTLLTLTRRCIRQKAGLTIARGVSSPRTARRALAGYSACAGEPGWLGSAATARVGTQNLLCAYLAIAVLAGLLADTLFGTWWLDGTVALAIAGWAVVEGRRAWAGQNCACACSRCSTGRWSRG